MNYGSFVRAAALFGLAFSIASTTGLRAAAFAQTADSSSGDSTQVKQLEQQLDIVKKQLAKTRAQCDQLQTENKALLKRLNESVPAASPFAPAPAAGRAAAPAAPASDPLQELTVLTLPTLNHDDTDFKPIQIQHPQWQSAAALSLKPAGASVTIDQKDPTHVAISVEKLRRGLGISEKVEAANLWLDNGTLWLQLLGDPAGPGQNPPGLDALRTSLLQIQDDGGGKLANCQFIPAQSATAPSDQPEPVKLTATADLMKDAHLVPDAFPDGWTNASTDPDQLLMKNGAVGLQFTLDRDEAQIQISRIGVPNLAELQRRLKWIDTQIADANEVVADTKVPKYRRASQQTVTGMEQNQDNQDAIDAANAKITDAKQRLTQLTTTKDNLTQQFQTAGSSMTAINNLGTVTVRLELPNGVQLAALQITTPPPSSNAPIALPTATRAAGGPNLFGQ